MEKQKRDLKLEAEWDGLLANQKDGYYLDGSFHHSQQYKERFSFIERKISETSSKFNKLP